MTSSKYDGIVEVVVGTMIILGGKVLLIQSTKWGDQWLFPGGHVEYGETVLAAAEREGREETGLSLQAKYVINFGEDIFIPEYHRRAHMMFYHVVCEAASDAVRLDPNELQQSKWMTPEQILNSPVHPNILRSVQRFIDGTRPEMESRAGEKPIIGRSET